MSDANKGTMLVAINAIQIGNRALLQDVVAAPTDNAIRAALKTHKAILGDIGLTDVLNEETKLTNAEAQEIKKAAVSRLNELLIKKAIDDITANDRVKLDAFFAGVAAAAGAGAGAAGDSPTAIRTALHAIPELRGNLTDAGLNNDDLLKDDAATRLRTAAIEKRKELNAAAINGAIPRANLATLTAIADVADADGPNGIRTALQAQRASLGNVDVDNPDLLTDREAGLIKDAAIARRKALIAETIKAAISTIPFANLNILTAIAGVTGGANAIRGVLQLHSANLGNVDLAGHVDNPDLLTDREAGLIQTAAIEKRKALNAEEIKKAISTTTFAGIAALKAIVDATPGPTEIRTAIRDNQANLGNVDLTADVAHPTLLTDDAANEIKKLATQKRNELIITDAINKFALDNPRVLKAVGDARGPDAIRIALNDGKDNLGGVSLTGTNKDLLSNVQAIAIQNLAKEKSNWLTIKMAVNNVRNPDNLDHLIAAHDPTEIRTELNQNQGLGSIDLTHGLNNPSLLTDEHANEIQNLAIQQKAVLRNRAKPVGANTLMQIEGQVEYFTDRLIKKGDTSAAPVAAPDPNAGNTQGQQAKAVVTKYKGYKLESGDIIRSIAQFTTTVTPPASATVPTPATTVTVKTGILEQDHTGKVTDMTASTEALLSEEKALMALKQAKMILINFKPDKGPIIIRGKDTEQANRLYAALLLLKGKQNIEIVSYVKGCKGPEQPSLFHHKASLDKAFILKHLKDLEPGQLKIEQESIEKFVETTVKRRNELKKMKDKGDTKGLAEKELKANEEVDEKGKILGR